MPAPADKQARPAAPAQPPAAGRARTTLRTLGRMADKGTPFACLTAYDYLTAAALDDAGVHVLLVGDSAANVVLGHDSTIHAPLEFLVELTAAVRRGAPHAVVMADMPFLSYHLSEDDAIKNAARFMTAGHADIVKIEANKTFAPLVRRMTTAGIPVCGHVGTRPQAAAVTSGPKAAGRTAAEARAIIDDAVALEAAGCQLLLVEAVPSEVTDAIMAATTVPLIGIGAGTTPHGQILVVSDLLGMTARPPRFALALANLREQITAAGSEYTRRVAARDLPADAYRMADGEAEDFARSAR